MERVGVHAQAGAASSSAVAGPLAQLVGQPELGDGGEHWVRAIPTDWSNTAACGGTSRLANASSRCRKAQDAADGEGGWRAPRHG